MNKYLLSLLAPAIISMASCSDIDSDDRYIAADTVAAQRAVLIEDFTGQNCVNCPEAHETMDKLVEQYPDGVIPVSIHAGSFGVSVSNTRYTGLMQPEGNTFNDAWGIDEWPKGVINRQAPALNHSEWAEAVRREIARPSTLSITVEARYDADNDRIAISTTLAPQTDIKAKLQLWVLEDGIVARQEDINLGRINDYVHNHVYRASVNGVGGENISLEANIHTTMDSSIDIRRNSTETWKPENLSIVAFAYDDSGVIQAAKAKVTVEESNQ